MQLRIFSVLGEALNFGLRRMETIIRLGWLPVVLLLIVNMVTVFAYLSVFAKRIITFSDVGTFMSAQTALNQVVARAWAASPMEMWAITGANLVIQAILVASFMAPLIRYSGLGERPRPGVIRLPFGVDQIRYIISGVFSFLFVAVLIIAPMAGATYYVLKYLFDALSKTVATFPDPNSLHTIKFVTTGEQLIADGAQWYLNLGVPLMAAAPFALLLWLITYLHFHPRNRPRAPETGNSFMRALVTLFVAGAAASAAYWLMREDIVEAFKSAGGADDSLKQIVANTPVNAHVLIGAVIALLAGYVNLRLYAYPAVAVCRKSLGLGNTLRVTRGWNLIRLQVILILAGAFIFLVQTVVLNQFFLSFFVPWIVTLLYQAVAVTTKLVNSGVTSEWVLPFFIWVWNGIKILVNIIGILFSYGVIAGLSGRLYRESEREDTVERKPEPKKAVWRRS